MPNWIACCGIAMVLCACDGLADRDTEGVALATLHGTIALGQDVEPPAKSLQVSVLWRDPIYGIPLHGGPIGRRTTEPEMPGKCESGKLTGWRVESPLLEQPVRVDTQFPSGFTVQITELPPAAALYHYPDDSGVSTASGDLVVYEDRNGNGRLDPSTFDEVSPDLVYGSSRGAKPWGVGQRYQYTIVYLSGDAESEGDGKAGYSLLTDESGTEGTTRVSKQRLSEAKIDLTLDPTAYVQQMPCSVMCSLDGNDTINDPAEFLKGDLGTELDWGLGVGEWVWSRQDGNSTTLSYARCTKEMVAEDVVEYEVELARETTEGCTQITLSQAYTIATRPETPIELGCKEYREVDKRK